MTIRWTVGMLISGVVITGSVVLLRHQIIDTKQMGAHARLKTIHQALELYEAQRGAYPTEGQSLVVLIDGPGRPGYLTGQYSLIDPWGAQYVYRLSHDGSPHLYSRGPNGIDEGGRGDDIVERLP